MWLYLDYNRCHKFSLNSLVENIGFKFCGKLLHRILRLYVSNLRLNSDGIDVTYKLLFPLVL